jgi:chromosome segregation ATPase
MSLFKERAANAKKVIALQNEIFSLKNKLAETPSAPAECKDCQRLKEELALSEMASKELLEENKTLKAEIKKLKSDLKKANKKISSLEAAE